MGESYLKGAPLAIRKLETFVTSEIADWIGEDVLICVCAREEEANEGEDGQHFLWTWTVSALTEGGREC